MSRPTPVAHAAAAPAVDPAVAALLPAYLERRAADARALAQALAAGDYAAVAAIGHRLKGLGTTYGHDAITACGRALEAAARAQDAAAIDQELAHYQHLVDGLRAEQRAAPLSPATQAPESH